MRSLQLSFLTHKSYKSHYKGSICYALTDEVYISTTPDMMEKKK